MKRPLSMKLPYLLLVLKQKVFGFSAVYNANNANEGRYTKRCLFIYLTAPFLLQEDDPALLKHQNLRQSRQIASILDEFGYIVDVVDWRDKKFVPRENYHLIISHRVKHDFDEKLLGRDVFKVYLFSGKNHLVFNRIVKESYENLFYRRGVRLQVRRLTPEDMPYVSNADALAGFGDQSVADSWKGTARCPIYNFSNYGFRETLFIFESKNFALAKKHFLFFASGSQIMKGLDLLLEIFPKHPDLHLFVCSSFKHEKDFCRLYNKELFHTPNIHPLGMIGTPSSAFYELCRKCAYVILPSAIEGQPGSVIQCMHAGLIPVVTKAVGIDTGDFGVLFPGNTVEEIEKTILHLSTLPENWHTEHSLATRKAAERDYSEEGFVKRWREILNDIEKIRQEKRAHEV